MKPHRIPLLHLGALLLTAATSSAQSTVYWDTNGTLAGSGNSGSSWEGVNWTTNPAGAATVAELAPWVDGNRAVFSAGNDGTGTWAVTLTSTIRTPSITFEEPLAASGNYRDINGGTIDIGGGLLDSSKLGFAAGNGNDVNIGSALVGTGGLTIAAHGDATSNGGGGGGAEFRLRGNNTFSGGLTITSGLVSFNANHFLGDPSNIITLNGGGLLYNDNALTLPRDIQVGAKGGTIRLYGGKTLTLEGTISNAAGATNPTLRRTDGGTVVIKTTGANFTGTFHNGGGSTQLAQVNANWSTTDFVVDGGNLNPNGTGTAVINSVNSTADVIIDNGTTLDVDTGAITMRGAHWYKTNSTLFGQQTLGKLTSSSGTLTVTNGATTGTLTTTDHRIVVLVTDFGTKPVTFVKNNLNTLILDKANTYSGGTIINGGRINSDHPQCFGTGTVTVNPGGQAWLTIGAGVYANDFVISGTGAPEATNLGAIRFNDTILSGNVTIAASGARLGADGNNFGTITGNLLGNGPLEIHSPASTATGAITLAGNASGYTGTATVAKGSLVIGAAFGGSATVSSTATLIHRGTVAGAVTVNDGAFLAGEGSVNGLLTLGSSLGGNLRVDGSTPGALTVSGGVNVTGMTTVHLTAPPAVEGSAVTVLTYTPGTLTLPGTLNEHFTLANAASYRNPVTFADTGSSITMTVPAGANLVWAGNDPTNPSFWDTNLTSNWLNGGVASPFFSGDHVLFDDSAANRTVAMQGMLSPASVTFNNSAGNDYTISPNGTFGFTGTTRIVKNGTGTVTLQGYAHNYTGTVTINGGVLQGNGNYEVLGNASAVTINDGGQLNINGLNLGNAIRHYNFTIAGTGPNGLGALTNSGTGVPNENAGIRNLTLSGDAAIGGNGGRFDVGNSGGLYGTIQGGGFTLTKVGTNMVNMRTQANNITYVVETGTLRFENHDGASGTNPITVKNGARVEGYGLRTFPNTLNLAANATLGNGGGNTQTWTGPVNLTGVAGDTVNLNAGGAATVIPSVISGNSHINVNGGNTLYLTGPESNTYIGNTTVAGTGQLVLGKSSGATAIPGDLIMAATGVRAIVATGIDNQFSPNTVFRMTGAFDNRFELKGTTQTIAGLDSTGTTTGENYIQHSEYGNTPAIDAVSDLVINVAEGNAFTYNRTLRDTGGTVNVTKSGPGTQTLLGGLIDFNGTTTVTAGRLIVNSDDTWTAGVHVATGAVYEVNVTSTTETLENRRGGFTLTGTGTYQKTGPGNMSMGWGDGASVAMAPGALIHLKEGSMRLEYGSMTQWTQNKADLLIDFGASLDLWDNNNAGVFVDALDGYGSVIRTTSVGEGTLTVGVDNGNGEFNGTISNTVGKTHLVKTGTGTQILAGYLSHSGNTTVNDGTLRLTEFSSLRFQVADATSNRLTGTGTVELNGQFEIDTTAVTVSSGSWTLVDTATLTESFGSSFSAGFGWTDTDNVWTRTDGDKTWTFSEATGLLTLSTSGTYADWIDGFFPGETNPAIIGTTADPDSDGVANAVEMLIGGDPASRNDSNLLPTIERVTNPGGTIPDGNYLRFTYRRTDASVLADLTATCQTDTDLLPEWTAATEASGAITVVDDDYAGFVPPATATDRVRVYVPLGNAAALYGRLQVLVP